MTPSIVRSIAILAPFVLLLLSPPRGTSVDADDVRDLEQQVDDYLSAYVDLAFFDGAVLVAQGDDVLLRKGYGRADYVGGREIDPDTQFRVASIAKPFTELAIGRLIEDGAMTRDTPVSTFIPDFPRGDEITVGHLLDNTSGVAHTNALPWYDQYERREWTLSELVDRIRQEPLDFEPGSRYGYSNGASVLMAYIIEAVSGRSYGDFLQEEVFGPLGMDDSGHEPRNLDLPGLAVGHVPGTSSLDERVPAPYVEMSLKIGGGSVYSTVNDLHRFGQALYSDNIVSAETWKMLIPASDGTITFSGRQPGYNAFFRRELKDGLTVVILSNNYAAGMLRETAESIVAMVRGGSYDPPLVTEKFEVETSDLQRFAGDYSLPDGSPSRLEVRNGNLAMIEKDSVTELFVPVRENTFILRLMWAEVSFMTADDSSTVTGAEVRLLVNGQTFPVTRNQAANR